MQRRTLGRSGIEVSALGLGCWAIGGPAWHDDRPAGWGDVDDEESIRAVHAALDLGVNFLDTADSYGAGHSERVLARALRGRRDRVVLATKFGNVFDEATRHISGRSADPDHIRRACDASLRRLETDRIDLYQFHIGNYEGDPLAVRDALEGLVAEGKIRWYGWSTDIARNALAFAAGGHCTAIQQRMNVFTGSAEVLTVCEQQGLASINRSPLGKGLLTGKFTAETTFPENDNRRGWDFRGGATAEQLKRLEAIRDILTSGGRTLAQGALCWLWARSEKTIPIPGFKTVAQVRENAGALAFDPLAPEQMADIERLLGR